MVVELTYFFHIHLLYDVPLENSLACSMHVIITAYRELLAWFNFDKHYFNLGCHISLVNTSLALHFIESTSISTCDRILIMQSEWIPLIKNWCGFTLSFQERRKREESREKQRAELWKERFDLLQELVSRYLLLSILSNSLSPLSCIKPS